MESFERHVYEKDLKGNPRSYCGEDLTSEPFYFEDIEHSEIAPKINLAVCSSCSFAIQNKNK